MALLNSKWQTCRIYIFVHKSMGDNRWNIYTRAVQRKFGGRNNSEIMLTHWNRNNGRNIWNLILFLTVSLRLCSLPKKLFKTIKMSSLFIKLISILFQHKRPYIILFFVILCTNKSVWLYLQIKHVGLLLLKWSPGVAVTFVPSLSFATGAPQVREAGTKLCHCFPAGGNLWNNSWLVWTRHQPSRQLLDVNQSMLLSLWDV